jgi:phosphoribosylformylglycinamidine synthase subunit PurL
VADGGLALALAEMAASSGVGARVRGVDTAAAFDEWLPRVVACVPAGVDVGPCVELGVAGGDRFVIEGVVDLSMDDVVRTYRETLPSVMGAGATH